MRSPRQMWGIVEEGNGHQRDGRKAPRGDSRVQTRRKCKRVRSVLHGTLGHLARQGRDLAPPGGHHVAAAQTSHRAPRLPRSACAEEVRGSPAGHSVTPRGDRTARVSGSQESPGLAERPARGRSPPCGDRGVRAPRNFSVPQSPSLGRVQALPLHPPRPRLRSRPGPAHTGSSPWPGPAPACRA